MAQQTSDTDRINELDSLLRTVDYGAFERAAVSSRDDFSTYSPWYSYALTSLALLTAGEELAFGQSELAEAGLAKIVVLTSTLVVVAKIDTTKTGKESPFVSAFPRHTLAALSLQSGQGVEERGSRRVGWPEQLVIELKYEHQAESVVLAGHAHDPFNPGNVGAIWTLLHSLRADLAGRK